MGNKSNKEDKNKKNQNEDSNKIKIKEKINENIVNYDSISCILEKRCITSFTILRHNKLMLTFKGGIIKIYELINSNPNNNEIKINEIIEMELDEYCFNYGIELKNGDLAVCSEDSTIKIIQIIFDNDKNNDIKNNNKEKNLNSDTNTNNNNINNNKYLIKQNIEKGDDPLYIIKEFLKGELVVGSWIYLYIFIKVPSINEYELINKIGIDDRTFSLIELKKGEILSSQCYSKTLTIYNIKTNEISLIKGIESNEHPNILCKYNNQNEIVFVAHDNGINIVSITHKCLMKNIIINEIVTSLCPLMIHLINKKSNPENIPEKFSLLCGVKKRVYGQKVNYYYNIIQYGFNLDDKSKNKGEIIFDKDENKNIKCYEISEKERAQLNEINAIGNSIFLENEILNINKNDQIIISIGSEDRRLKLWKNKNDTVIKK